jgi:hypothetical protein
MSYYVDNKAVLVSKDIWYREDKDIHVGNQWNVEENFLKEEQGWRIIIAAPFGIGKTSLTKHLILRIKTS